MNGMLIAHYHVTAFMIDGSEISGACGTMDPPSLDCFATIQLSSDTHANTYNEIRTKDIGRLLVRAVPYQEDAPK